MKQLFSIAEVTDCLGYNETAIRKLINDAHDTRIVDENIIDPGETITRDQLINLWTSRTGQREARKLAELLR